METTKDIIAEMRIRCVDKNHSPELWEYLDRIEKAVTNCNQLKMREALKFATRLLMDVTESDEYGDDVVFLVGCMRTVAKACRTALQEPVRNCDAFSKSEVLKMLEDRSFSKEDTIEWLYAEAEGETDEQK